jgi:hypothetical protein
MNLKDRVILPGGSSWFDETAHAGREHLDADYVTVFDQKSRRDWSREIAALKCARNRPREHCRGFWRGHRVVRSRTGAIGSASGGDRSLVRDGGSHGKVRVKAVRAGFLTYEHVREAPDAAFSCNALHHLPGYWKVPAWGVLNISPARGRSHRAVGGYGRATCAVAGLGVGSSH